MRRIFIKLLLFLFLSSPILACDLLQVPIETPINTAQIKLEFLDVHNADLYEEEAAVKYLAAAIDYCEGSQLENADLEVIIYDNKVAGIILTSVDEEFTNEIYEFTKFNINDPGEDAKGKSWKGFKDLSIGNLLVYYTKMEQRGEIAEILKITNAKMLNNTIGEQVIDFIE